MGNPRDMAAGKAADTGGRLMRNASVVAGATLASRLLGFLRDVIIAFALGAAPGADAFFVAFRLPNLLRRLFGEGTLTMAFIPAYAETRARSGEREAHAMARACLVWLLAVLGGLVVLGVIFAPELVSLIAPGFRDDPGVFALTVELTRTVMPYALFICGVALCMGILNASGHFFAPALAPVVLNIGLISAALLAVVFGGSVPQALVWGALVAGAGQWLLQQPFLNRLGFRWFGAPVRPGEGGRALFGSGGAAHPGARRVGRLLLPTVYGASAYQMTILLGTIFASLLPAGSVSALYYADRLVQLPLALFGVAVSTAALPELSRLRAEGEAGRFASALRGALRGTLFLSLPAAAGLAGLALPVVDALFGRGAFDLAAVHTTSQALAAYAAGLPALAAARPLISACYARQDTRLPSLASTAGLGVYALCGWLLMQDYGVAGLAAATSLSAWTVLLILSVSLRRTLGPWLGLSRFWGPVAAMAFASLLLWAGSVRFAASGVCSPWQVVATIPLWAVLYFAATAFLGVTELERFRPLAAGLMRRFRKSRER